MSVAEQPLWDYLDDCGIEFRQPKSALKQTYGSHQHEWLAGSQMVSLASPRPFLNGLAYPISFQFDSGADLADIPRYFTAYMRQSDDIYQNYNDAVAQLSALFGPGADVAATNVDARQWRFGLARVSATIWPPSRNPGLATNQRYQHIPGSMSECAIVVETGYCIAPHAAEREALSSYSELSATHPAYDTHLTGLSRRHAGQCQAGFGVDNNKRFLIRYDQAQTVQMLPIEWIQQVEYVQLTPAKGAGGISIGVAYQPPAYSKPGFLRLLEAPFEPGAYRSVALNLSQHLSVPLADLEMPDC